MSRHSSLEMNSEEFRKTGYELVDSISSFIKTIENKKVTTTESAEELKKLLGNVPVPENGSDPGKIIAEATELLLNHSLLNGHPKFLGYITGSAAPICALADLLAAAVNPNVGANILSPVATEIEKQTIRWIADMVGLPSHYGGILVSGGNMANFTAFLAARTAKGPKNIKEEGISRSDLAIYCPKTTHVWIEKAVILFGHGSKSLRWISTDKNNRMDIQLLEKAILEDLNNKSIPMMVVGNAGDVSTGVIDDLEAIGNICSKYDLWFHIDGAYGLPAAIIPEMKPLFKGIEVADSIAMDPHKWMYSPLEAGCTLVRDMDLLLQTFSLHPAYYNFSNNKDGSEPFNYYEYGLQNSRGFRALKVWLAIQQAGRKGYEEMISEDIRLSKLLFSLARKNPELEAVTQNLSIATLRYIPEGIFPDDLAYLNHLNEALVNDLQAGGEAFLSNAIIDEKYCLRTCIVNFRTAEEDIMALIDIIIKQGRKIHKTLRDKTAGVKDS